MFFGGKKRKAVSEAAGRSDVNGSDASTDLKKITESLYKQNLELSVKNKTLSLLRALYQISILALKPEELSEKIVKTVRESLQFELVGILVSTPEKGKLQPMYFDRSDRLKKWEEKFGLSPDMSARDATAKNSFFTPILESNALNHTNGFLDVWTGGTSGAVPPEAGAESHIRATVGYPLVIEGKITGVFVVSLNREYQSMLPYEKESIASLVDVAAVALDKSRLYKELEVANTKLIDANDRLRELDQTKSEFISLATHQIRSPLTAIKGYASLILEGDYGNLSPQLENVVKIIFDSCENLVTIVGEFLDISRIELGQMKYEKTKFDFEALVEETVEQLRPNIEQAGLSLDFQAEKGCSYEVNADRIKLKQVISNLVDNSIKYTPAGSLSLAIKRVGGKILFSIKDTGVGIEPEEAAKLFSKFTRAKDASRVNVHGTGLGLYVAKQMVEANSGRLWVESDGKGKGTTFRVELDAL